MMQTSIGKQILRSGRDGVNGDYQAKPSMLHKIFRGMQKNRLRPFGAVVVE